MKKKTAPADYLARLERRTGLALSTIAQRTGFLHQTVCGWRRKNSASERLWTMFVEKAKAIPDAKNGKR